MLHDFFFCDYISFSVVAFDIASCPLTAQGIGMLSWLPRPCIAPVLVEKHMHAHNNTPSHTETALRYKYRLLFRSLRPGVRPIRRQHKKCALAETCRILSHFCFLVRETDLGRSRLPFFRKCVDFLFHRS